MYRQLDDHLTKGWIKPSVFPYGAAILFVYQKEGKLCICINFRMLNKQIKINVYPIPQIDEVLDYLCKAQVILKIDLSKVHH